MNTQLLLLILILLIQLPVWGQVDTSSFGIIPLSTNRAEIEKRFAKISDDCNCRYESEKYTFRVVYSKSLCDQHWNVPIDTVIKVTFSPKNKLPLEDLKINEENFYRVTQDDLSYSLSDLKEGVQYFLFPQGYPNHYVESIRYIPTLAQGLDEKFRCKNAPNYSPMNELYDPFSFGNSEVWWEIFSDLRELSVSFKDSNKEMEFALYLFVYFSKKYSQKGQAKMINKIETTLRDLLKSNYKNVIILNGGTQTYFEIKGIFLPKDYPPPIPNPEISRHN